MVVHLLLINNSQQSAGKMKILIMLEDNNGKIHRMGLESIVAAQKMASELNGELGAVVMGKNADALADEAASYKLDEVIKVKDSLLDNYYYFIK